MKVQQRTLLSCALGGVLGMSAGAGLAQEGGRSTSVLEEIVVTAQKRSESLQDVPVAVSAFTSEVRDLIGITTIGDLTDLTPGLSYATVLDRMSLRGIGRLTNNYGSDPGIATYSDGFYTASNVEAGKRPIHTERIEVLRGPQGTLYGRNSIGGALNIVSPRPTDTWQGEVRAVAGNYDTQIFDAALSGPITDWLRFRASGSSGGQGVGFYRDEDGGPTEGNVGDDLYAEGQLEFNIGDAFDGWFKYSHTEWDQRRRFAGTPITPQDISPRYFGGLFPNTTFNGPQAAVAPPTVPGVPSTGTPGFPTGIPNVSLAAPAYTTTNPGLSDPRMFNTDTPFHTHLDNVNNFTLELVWHAGFADVKYVGGYQGYTYTQESDFDGTSREAPYTVLVGGGRSLVNPALVLPPTPFTIFPQVRAFYQEDKEYYSNEINLISTDDGPFQWIVGLYQYHEQVYQFAGVNAPNQPQLDQPRLSAASPATALGPPNPDRILQNAGAWLDADAAAVFGQIDYSFSDHWKTTIGVRYTEDRKDAEEFRTRALYGFATFIAQAPPPAPVNPFAGLWTGLPYAFYSEIDRRNPLAGKWHATTGTAGLEWTPNDDTLTFVKYTRGYKSGGFNAGQFAVGRTGYTDPEFINSYEFGIKQTIAQRLTANLSLFYYDYKDAQYPSSVRDPVSNIVDQRFFNLQGATSMGAELEANWAVSDALNLYLSYAYLDTEIEDDRCFIDGDDTGYSGVLVSPQGRPCGPFSFGDQIGQKIDGGRLPSSPKNKVALNANYTFYMPAGNLTFSGTWTYKDEAYYSVFTRDHNLAPAYDETDVRLLWNEPNNRYTIIAYAKNVFDQEGYESAGASMSAWGVQSRSRVLTSPRTYGIEAQFRFGN
jgi:iron complex outermembrane receptor protein